MRKVFITDRAGIIKQKAVKLSIQVKTERYTLNCKASIGSDSEIIIASTKSDKRKVRDVKLNYVFPMTVKEPILIKASELKDGDILLPKFYGFLLAQFKVIKVKTDNKDTLHTLVEVGSGIYDRVTKAKLQGGNDLINHIIL